MGIRPQERLSRARRIRPRRGRRRLPRSPRRHDRGLLVAAAFVATPASRDLPGETPAVSRVLSIHPQRAKARKGAAVRPPRGDPRPSNYPLPLSYFRRPWERLSHHPETQHEPECFGGFVEFQEVTIDPNQK